MTVALPLRRHAPIPQLGLDLKLDADLKQRPELDLGDFESQL